MYSYLVLLDAEMVSYDEDDDDDDDSAAMADMTEVGLVGVAMDEAADSSFITGKSHDGHRIKLFLLSNAEKQIGQEALNSFQPLNSISPALLIASVRFNRSSSAVEGTLEKDR